MACGLRVESASSRDSTAESLCAAASFLAGEQMTDGTWCSSRHGVFREGDVLTAPVLWALEGIPRNLQPRKAICRGRQWLGRTTDELGHQHEPWLALRYPLFTASYAARLCAAANKPAHTTFWAGLLTTFQISPGGGWSDACMPPRAANTPEVPDMWKPNLSATVCALEGLQAAGRDERCREALPFVCLCQNFAGDSATATASDDGGFFFTPDDPIRNKAGAFVTVEGQRRFRSYGSATCDGLLSLLHCGLPANHPRVMAAIRWLQRNAGSDAHPGDWPVERKDSGRSLEFYFAHGFAAALHRVFTDSPDHRPWCRDMMHTLASSLRHSQRADGSWANDEPESLEDDPLLATAVALRALATCAQALTRWGL